MPNGIVHDQVPSTGGYDIEDLHMYYAVPVSKALNDERDLNGVTDYPEWLSDVYKEECTCPFCQTIRGWFCAKHAATREDGQSRFSIDRHSLKLTLLSSMRHIDPALGTIELIKDEMEKAGVCSECGEDHALFVVDQTPDGDSTNRVCISCILRLGLQAVHCSLGCGTYKIIDRDITTYFESNEEEFEFGPNRNIVNNYADDYGCSDCLDGCIQECYECSDSCIDDYDTNLGRYAHAAIDYHGDIVYFCEDCVSVGTFFCYHCEERIINDLMATSDPNAYCETCYGDLAEVCEECDETYIGRCTCLNEYSIKNYSYKPNPPTFFDVYERNGSTVRKTMYFGVEVELDYRRANRENAAAIVIKRTNEAVKQLKRSHMVKGEQLGFMYAKNDSTVGNGAEFVTCPFTFDWFKYNRDVFKTFYDSAKEQGFQSAPNCGLHVHISRTKHGLVKTRLYKLCYLLYGHPFFAEEISGRPNGLNSYCSVQEGKKVLLHKSKTGFGGHRGAVNCGGNGTIEIRLFGSPKDFDEFVTRMYMVKALIEFVTQASLNDCTPQAFAEYVQSQEHLSILNPTLAKYRS